MSDVFPEKMYYSIGEVSRISGVPPYILRYWESQISQINPIKDSGGLRRYRKKDMDAIIKVKYLVYDKKHTVAGAKEILKKEKEGADIAGEDKRKLVLQKIKNELLEIKAEITKMRSKEI